MYADGLKKGTDFTFFLEYKDAIPFGLNDTLESGITDDFGYTATFDGSAFPVLLCQNYNIPRHGGFPLPHRVYIKVIPIIDVTRICYEESQRINNL